MESKENIKKILEGMQGLVSDLEGQIKNSYSNLDSEQALRLAKQFEDIGINKKFSDAKESISKTINSFNNVG